MIAKKNNVFHNTLPTYHIGNRPFSIQLRYHTIHSTDNQASNLVMRTVTSKRRRPDPAVVNISETERMRHLCNMLALPDDIVKSIFNPKSVTITPGLLRPLILRFKGDP